MPFFKNVVGVKPSPPGNPKPNPADYGMDDILEDLFMEKNDVENIRLSLQKKKNIIYKILFDLSNWSFLLRLYCWAQIKLCL